MLRIQEIFGKVARRQNVLCEENSSFRFIFQIIDLETQCGKNGLKIPKGGGGGGQAEPCIRKQYRINQKCIFGSETSRTDKVVVQ